MIENIVIQYLGQQLQGVNIPVSGEIPTPLPVTFITVEKTGSRTADKIRTATLAVQSWAGSQEAASALNETVIGFMAGIASLDSIGACRCVSDYNYTDVRTKHHRYQAVFDVTYY